MSYLYSFVFFFFKQKTAYEMRISDWSSDVCSSDLVCREAALSCNLSGTATRPSRKGPIGPIHNLRASASPRESFSLHPPRYLRLCAHPVRPVARRHRQPERPFSSEEHTSELPSLMRSYYSLFSLKTQ